MPPHFDSASTPSFFVSSGAKFLLESITKRLSSSIFCRAFYDQIPDDAEVMMVPRTSGVQALNELARTDLESASCSMGFNGSCIIACRLFVVHHC